MAVVMWRVPIKGWKRCAHTAAAFESGGELNAAYLLDDSPGIQWWVRNDPVMLRISTPAGGFEPDFFYQVEREGKLIMGILEIKGEIFWNGQGSIPRIKSAAATAWVQATEEVGTSPSWEFAIILEQDALEANTLDQLLQMAEERYPKPTR
jgi:hypothetical protein